MKTRIVLLVTLFTVILASHSSAGTTRHFRTDSASTASIIKAKSLLMRLDVIRATDQSNYTKEQKKILRKESRVIKGTLKELRGGRYVRTALIVLILVIPLSVYYVTEQ